MVWIPRIIHRTQTQAHLEHLWLSGAHNHDETFRDWCSFKKKKKKPFSIISPLQSHKQINSWFSTNLEFGSVFYVQVGRQRPWQDSHQSITRGPGEACTVWRETHAPCLAARRSVEPRLENRLQLWDEFTPIWKTGGNLLYPCGAEKSLNEHTLLGESESLLYSKKQRSKPPIFSYTCYTTITQIEIEQYKERCILVHAGFMSWKPSHSLSHA